MYAYEGYTRKNGKSGLQFMRPYVEDTDMSNVTVADDVTPELGGMICLNLQDESDKWYITEQDVKDNYEKT